MGYKSRNKMSEPEAWAIIRAFNNQTIEDIETLQKEVEELMAKARGIEVEGAKARGIEVEGAKVEPVKDEGKENGGY